MAGTKYMPHNPRTAAVVIEVERRKRDSPDWNDSLTCCANWERSLDHKRDIIKMLGRELQRLDYENNELRQLLRHHLGEQVEGFLKEIDNGWNDAHVSTTIMHLDPDHQS